MPTESPRDVTRQYDDATESFGRAHGFDHTTGNFRRVRSNGPIEVLDGPVMVGRQLARALLTRKGEDPFRPEFGLDLEMALGESDLHTKEAIRDAIGPDADPRVQRLEPSDIEISRPRGNREETVVEVTAHLVSGDPVGLGVGPQWWRAIATRSDFTGVRQRS
jgi:hypothetical protein